ncbi:muscle M-line assembly protein unc-89 [Misgurnus anguillicaudatus]|uniref:muscle M-line assembly protein unc-89 n=1 Tax=Misgurnus anguillicaudatus TaxID=75329 RepID=UPI003CCF2950
MSDYLLLFSFSLLLAGVFSAYVTVSVMTGDDVTLNPDAIHEMRRWKFKGIEIGTNNQSRNRPNVDSQTGSLFIQNIRTEDTGEYKLEIKRSNDKTLQPFKTFNVILNDKVESVSGVKGGFVTLNTDTQPQTDDVIEWKFENTSIAKVDKRIPSDYFNKERFGDRLHVDSRGSLIITQIKMNESGQYDVNITSSKQIIHKRFSLTVSGVFSAYVTVSVMKGDDVTLNPNVIHEMRRWKFKDIEIKTTDQSRNRLNTQTGSLTIQNISTEDTGEYQLEIKTSEDKVLKPFKTFNVILNDQVITVSVMKEDSFTLPTGVQKQPVDVKWTFNGTDLTGSTITNIRPEQFGEYKGEIDCRDFILQRTLSVKFNDKVESVSVTAGETVTLNTNTPRQADDVIEWKLFQ